MTAKPNILWPPNHKFISVAVSADVTDNCETPVCKIISVTSNEPSNGHGPHDNDPDFIITGNLTVDLRAERLGHGSGRIYTMTIQCTDKAGNTSTSQVTATVPHDQRDKKRLEGNF